MVSIMSAVVLASTVIIKCENLTKSKLPVVIKVIFCITMV